MNFVGAIQPACLANSDWIIANSLRLIRSHRVKLLIRSHMEEILIRSHRGEILIRSSYRYTLGTLEAACLDFVGAIQQACLANSDWIIANSLRLIRSHRVKLLIRSHRVKLLIHSHRGKS